MMAAMAEPQVRAVLESRPVLACGYSFVSDIEVLHWADRRMPFDLGAALNSGGDLAIVVKPRRSYYWHIAWEIEDAESTEEESSP
jgi:hypothetical protein